MLHKFKVRKDDYLRGIYSRKSERPKPTQKFGGRWLWAIALLFLTYGSTASSTRLSGKRDRVGNTSEDTVKKN
ncbi:hypothetical protein QUA30_25360 [Microcoleus sp. Pol14C2]|uniref:hypothetical protein n=1 Tax=unclassified Microcoleus TaxID=2642155 RepID=UPI002FD07799